METLENQPKSIKTLAPEILYTVSRLLRRVDRKKKINNVFTGRKK